MTDQLSLEEIIEKTKQHLWFFSRLEPTGRTFKYVLSEEESRAIVLELRAELNRPPKYKLEDCRDSLGDQILFSRFAAPATIQADAPHEQVLKAAADYQRMTRHVDVRPDPLPHHTYQDFALIYHVNSSSNDALRRVTDKGIERPPVDKTVLVLQITDYPGSQEKALLVMNAFYRAYAAVKGISKTPAV